MNETSRKSSEPIVHALLALVPPPALAWVLWQVGPEHITVYENQRLQLLYWVPAVLAFVTAVAATCLAAVGRASTRSGRRSLIGTSVAGFVMVPPTFLFGIVCLLMSSIGVEDGGWA